MKFNTTSDTSCNVEDRREHLPLERLKDFDPDTAETLNSMQERKTQNEREECAFEKKFRANMDIVKDVCRQEALRLSQSGVSEVEASDTYMSCVHNFTDNAYDHAKDRSPGK